MSSDIDLSAKRQGTNKPRGAHHKASRTDRGRIRPRRSAGDSRALVRTANRHMLYRLRTRESSVRVTEYSVANVFSARKLLLRRAQCCRWLSTSGFRGVVNTDE